MLYKSAIDVSLFYTGQKILSVTLTAELKTYYDKVQSERVFTLMPVQVLEDNQGLDFFKETVYPKWQISFAAMLGFVISQL